MNKVQLPKLIKWVLSGACHPIALFQRVHADEKSLDRSQVKKFYKSFRHLYATQEHFNRHVELIYFRLLFNPAAIKRALSVKGVNPETEQYSPLYAESLYPLPGHSVSETIKTLTEFRKDDYGTTGHHFIITDGEVPTTSFAEIGQRFLNNHGLKVEPCPTFKKIMAEVPVDPSETNTD